MYYGSLLHSHQRPGSHFLDALNPFELFMVSGLTSNFTPRWFWLVLLIKIAFYSRTFFDYTCLRFINNGNKSPYFVVHVVSGGMVDLVLRGVPQKRVTEGPICMRDMQSDGAYSCFLSFRDKKHYFLKVQNLRMRNRNEKERAGHFRNLGKIH